MAGRSRPGALDRADWLSGPDETEVERERRAELREQRLMIAAAVAVGVLNVMIIAAAVWDPANTFELTPLLPK